MRGYRISRHDTTSAMPHADKGVSLAEASRPQWMYQRRHHYIIFRHILGALVYFRLGLAHRLNISMLS